MLICVHSGEQKYQNGPENQMISKLRLENRFFRQSAWGTTVMHEPHMTVRSCIRTYIAFVYMYIFICICNYVRMHVYFPVNWLVKFDSWSRIGHKIRDTRKPFARTAGAKFARVLGSAPGCLKMLKSESSHNANFVVIDAWIRSLS